MFWKVTFIFDYFLLIYSLYCFSSPILPPHPLFLFILVYVLHLGAFLKCLIFLDVCEWDSKKLVVVCAWKAHGTGDFLGAMLSNCQILTFNYFQVPLSMFLSGIFQFFWKMVLHSAVLREGPHQGWEGGRVLRHTVTCRVSGFQP